MSFNCVAIVLHPKFGHSLVSKGLKFCQVIEGSILVGEGVKGMHSGTRLPRFESQPYHLLDL